MLKCANCGETCPPSQAAFRLAHHILLCCHACAESYFNEYGATITWNGIVFDVPPGCAHLKQVHIPTERS